MYQYPTSTLIIFGLGLLVVLFVLRSDEKKSTVRVINPIPIHQYEEQGRRYTESKLKELTESPAYKRLAQEKKLPTPTRLNFTGS